LRDSSSINISTSFLEESSVYQSWLTENALAYSLWRLSDPSSIGFDEYDNYLNVLEKEIVNKTGNVVLSERLSGLSLNTLTMLNDLSPKMFKPLADKENRVAVDRLLNKKNKSDEEQSYFARIKNLASLILHSDVEAPFLFSICSSDLDTDWKELIAIKEAREALTKCLSAVRSHYETDLRINSLQLFADYLKNNGYLIQCNEWFEVSREVISRLMGWPLIVLPSAHNSAKHGFSIPIKIDVQFDGLARTKCIGMGKLSQFDWGSSLMRAREVANTFWGYQHTRLPDHKVRTEGASVTLDLSPTVELLSKVGDQKSLPTQDRAEGELIGRSLEVYLAMMIIGKFMGAKAFPRTAITGMIGEPIEDEFDNTKRPRNWKFQKVGGTDSKILWAAKSKDYDRLILPYDSLKVETDSQLELVYSYDLLKVVDTVFGSRWRRQRYIRCPELAHLSHLVTSGRKKIYNSLEGKKLPTTEVKSTLTWLKDQSSVAVKCPREITAERLLKTYTYLNDVTRVENKLVQYPKRAVTFLRINNEEGERLASIIADAMNATVEMSNSLVKAKNSYIACKHLAEIATDLDGSYGVRKIAAPDVIVVLVPSSKLAIKKLYRSNNFDLSILLGPNFDSLVKEKTINETHDRAAMEWVEHAGLPRILIVEDDNFYNIAPFLRNCEGIEKQKRVLRKLRHLPAGFDDRILNFVLKAEQKNSIKRAELIEELIESNALIRTFSGYFINPRIELGAEHLGQQVKYKERALMAYAPHMFLEMSNGAMDEEAFSLSYIHEAQNQLNDLIKARSANFRSGAIDKSVKMSIQKLKNCRNRLAVIGRKSWATLGFLAPNMSSFDVLPFILEGDNWVKKHGFPYANKILGQIEMTSEYLIRLSQLKASRSLTHNEQRLYDYYLREIKGYLSAVIRTDLYDAKFLFVHSHLEVVRMRVFRTRAFFWPVPKSQQIQINERLKKIIMDTTSSKLAKYSANRKWLLKESRNRGYKKHEKSKFLHAGRQIHPKYKILNLVKIKKRKNKRHSHQTQYA